MIDLRTVPAEVAGLIREALVQFESEYPDERWSAIAIDSAPVFGWFRVSFDTKANSDSVVAAFCHNGPDWYGEDRSGRFNDNCEEFKYTGYRAIEKPDWEVEFMEHHDCFTHIDSRGVVRETDMHGLGNEGFNALIFPLFIEVRRTVIPWLAINARNMDQVARFGVQMCDSQYCDFTSIPRVVSGDA